MSLGRIPIRLLGLFRIRFRIFYQSANPEHPARKILVPFFREIKYALYDDRVPTARERRIWQKMMSISQRIPVVWPVPFISDDRKHLWGYSGSKQRRILIHPHLDGHHGWKGATAKIWKIENWITFISNLHEQGYNVAITEWDVVARDKIIHECPFVEDKSNGTLRELCLCMRDYDCVVSVDSWMKYPAAWQRKRQVVIIPDLRSGYTPGFSGISADWIARWWFHGLMNKAHIAVLGLKRVGDKYVFTLPNLDRLTVGCLLQEIRRLLPAG